MSKWQACDLFKKGQSVKIVNGEFIEYGFYKGVDEKGNLVIANESNNKYKEFMSGMVSLRKAN